MAVPAAQQLSLQQPKHVVQPLLRLLLLLILLLNE
jgi:hypothetical protein